MVKVLKIHDCNMGLHSAYKYACHKYKHSFHCCLSLHGTKQSPQLFHFHAASVSVQLLDLRPYGVTTCLYAH